MALVAYDYSDSENEDETDSSEVPTTIESDKQDKTMINSKPPDKPLLETELKPQTTEKGKVRISIPHLKPFEAEEEKPSIKKTHSSGKGTGLLSLLPPVRGTILTAKSFIPNSLKNKSTASSNGKLDSKLVPHAVKRRADLIKQASIKKLLKTSDNDLESDDDTEIPETFNEKLWEQTCGRPLKKYKETIYTPLQSLDSFIQPTINIAPQPARPVDGLDNEAFKELVGKSKRPLNIKLIDLNEDEVLSDKDMWMTKSLTDPEMKPKPEIEEAVDPTRKKKHHITYLAELAKEKEEEFANNWSASKYTRNQTRAKYGF